MKPTRARPPLAVLPLLVLAALAVPADGAAPADPLEAAIRPALGEALDEVEIVRGDAFAAEVEARLAAASRLLDDLGAPPDLARAARLLPGALRRAGLLALAGLGRGEWVPGDGSVFATTFWYEGGATNPTLPGLLATAPEPVLAPDSPYAHSLADELPAASILAWTSSLDPRECWRAARALLPEVAPARAAELDAALARARGGLGVDADAVVASLRPGVLVALAVDTNRTISLPGAAAPVPAPGVLAAVRAEDATAFRALERLLPALGVAVKPDEYGIAHCLDVVLPTNAPAWLAPRIEWLPDEGLLIAQSHPAITGAGNLVAAHNDEFWDYAGPLGPAGDLGFVSPAFHRLAAQILGADATNAPAVDAWFVSRTVRLPGRGVLRRSRSCLPPGSVLAPLLAEPRP